MKVAFLSNFTVDLLAKEFQTNSNFEIYISGFNQFLFDVQNNQSNYYLTKPDFSVFILDWESMFQVKSLDELKKEIEELFQVHSLSLDNYFIINTAYLSASINSISNYNTPENVKKMQCELNLFLTNLAVTNKNFFVLDILSILEQHGTSKIYDKGSWIYAKNRFSKFGLKEISKKLSSLINAICINSKKCLILDLDNTLWGGAVSEEGAKNVLLGTDGPGKEYQDLQKAILEIKNKGVILCICSKNDYNDVANIFNHNPDMVLNFDDFVLKKINWNSKDSNIKEIVNELDISEQSIVFLDDNPLEREIVRQNTDVIVPEFPSEIEELKEFIMDIDERYFAKLMFTEEDSLKTEFYKQNITRFDQKRRFNNFDEFLQSLEIKLVIGEASDDDVIRLSQLTQKTNQFNLTNKKYTANDLKSLLQSHNFKVFFGEVSDKFGKYGKVLLLILEIHDHVAHFDTFLMSCRVFGRLVEETFVKEIAKKLVNIDLLTADYIPSQKNYLVEKKLKELGFEYKYETDRGKFFSWNFRNSIKL